MFKRTRLISSLGKIKELKITTCSFSSTKSYYHHLDYDLFQFMTHGKRTFPE